MFRLLQLAVVGGCNAAEIQALETSFRFRLPQASASSYRQFLFLMAVLTENSVRCEITGVPTIREIVVATTMSSLFVAFFALVASSFRTRAALQAETSRFATNLRFAKRTRRVACASTAATGSCGLGCTDSGPAGGDVSR